METNERIRKLEVALKAFIMLVDFVRGEIDAIGAVDTDQPGLAGELAAAKAENTELKREVAKLEKKLAGDPLRRAKAAQIQTQLDNEKNAPPALPMFVERRGKKFGCYVQQKGMKFRKGGFDTPDAAHDYAIRRIKEHDGEAGEGKKLPRFIYKRGDKYDVLCNRKNVYLSKTGFKTAEAASEWAEAEFTRKSAESAATSTTDSSHANRGDPDRPYTPAEVKAAIDKKREQTGNVARKWVECAGCSHELGVPGGELPDSCPKCGSVKIAVMEGFAGADAVEVRR